ncbi:hypothetical protein LCGC14_0753060 [marine sediment metagenome]|uniref:Uncharacterized protein n=1 Tax=marine sediment metagenome TaxID=412755 RepID=A0A0F9QNA6_9ZZZZ
MDEYIKGFLHGVAVAIILMVVSWVTAAFEVEKKKVTEGYLTFQHKTYSVILYDELKQPPKHKKGDTDGKDK